MRRWIRWKGLIPFVIISAIIFIVWQFFVDGYIERLIERSGTRAVGAKVDLGSADLSLIPLGATLNGLEVTNPDDPMKNVIQVDRINLALDGSALLFRKVIVDEMAAEGVRFDTPRKKSGALQKKKEKVEEEKKVRRLRFPSLKLPDVKEIVEKEDLETLRLVKETRADIEREQNRWKAALERLPDKKKIEEYESRIDEVKAAAKGKPLELLASAEEIKELKEDIEKDIREIKDTREGVEKSITTFKGRLDTLEKAPKRDFQRLKEKYSISPKGLSNVTQLIMGETTGRWVERVLLWHERLKPFLETSQAEKTEPRKRGRGVDVTFKEYDPKPDILIRLANMNVTLKDSTFSGTIENITDEQNITGVPIKFNFSGSNLKDVQSVKFGGTLDHINPKESKDIFNLSMKGFQIRALKLSRSEELPITMKSGMVNLDLFSLLSEDAVQGHVNGTISAATIAVDAHDEIGRIIASVLEDIRTFNIKAYVVGAPDDYKITISSNLDNELKRALGSQLAKLTARWEESLNSAIREKTSGQVKGLNEKIAGLSVLNSELESRNRQMTNLLSELSATTIPGIKLPF